MDSLKKSLLSTKSKKQTFDQHLQRISLAQNVGKTKAKHGLLQWEEKQPDLRSPSSDVRLAEPLGEKLDNKEYSKR